jgi:hypothetical protein
MGPVLDGLPRINGGGYVLLSGLGAKPCQPGTPASDFGAKN